MRTTAPFDFTHKLFFPFNIYHTTIPLHPTQPFFLQPIRMSQPAPTPITRAPHPIQSQPNHDNNNNNPPQQIPPPPPEKPDPGDCCGSGCVRCVWDVYYDQLEEYNKLYKQDDSKPKPSS